MLTTTVAGRTWNFSHAIGRDAAAGAGFTYPTAVAVAPGDVLYVLSRGSEGTEANTSDNKRITKVTMDQELLGEFATGEFTWPTGLALDSDGNLYCSDEHENIIAAYDGDGQRLEEWGEAGSGGGQLRGPAGLAFDGEDNLFVVDSLNGRVQVFTRDGRYLRGWGSPGSGEGQLNQPWGITVDGNGDVYVADWGNDRVQKFAPDGTYLLAVGSTVGDGGDLDHPADVAVDSEGDIYVTDWGNKRVQIYDPDGEIITALYGDATEFSNWAQEVVNSNPDVRIAFRRVRDISPLGRFERPRGIAIDGQDRITVSDSTRGRVQIYVKEKDFIDPQFNL